MKSFADLPWDHEKSLKAEVELAAWLSREFSGKVMITSAGPDIRERFKSKFSLSVFSTPDLIFVPEFCDDEGRLKGYGPPFAFDITERNYAPGDFLTVYAQVSKTDNLARFGPDAFLAYKWRDGSWTFVRAAGIAALKLRPRLVDTEVGGKKSRQRVYSVPLAWWYSREEFKTIVTEKIKDFEPLDHVKILRQVDEAREADLEEFVSLLSAAVGSERLRDAAKYVLSIKAMIRWDPKRELEPAIYILQRVLGAFLKREEGRRKGGRGARGKNEQEN